MSAVLKAKTHLCVPRPGGLQISYAHLKSLEFAVARIPPKIPKRWDLISRFVMDSAIDRAEESPDVQLCERGGPSFTGIAKRRTNWLPNPIPLLWRKVKVCWRTSFALTLKRCAEADCVDAFHTGVLWSPCDCEE